MLPTGGVKDSERVAVGDAYNAARDRFGAYDNVEGILLGIVKSGGFGSGTVLVR